MELKDGNTCENVVIFHQIRFVKACMLLNGLEINRAKVTIDNNSAIDGAAKLTKLEQLSFKKNKGIYLYIYLIVVLMYFD